MVLALTIFQILKLDSFSSEIDDIGVYQSIAKVKQEKKRVYQLIKEMSEPELINEIKLRYGNEAKELALYLHKAHMLKPSLKLIATYRTFYSVPKAFTYAPGQYFITQFLINGEESYKIAKLKIRVISKLFWLFGIIGIFIILSKIKLPFKNQACLLFLVLIVCSISQTSYSSHGSNYAAGLFASSIVILVIISLMETKRFSFPIILWLLLASLIQYQLIPSIFFIFAMSWFIYLFFKFFINKKNFLRFSNLFNFSLTFIILFLMFVYLTFRKKIKSGLNWNVGKNSEYTLNDNYLSLFSEVTYQKLFIIIIEPFKALAITLASIYSPISFSNVSANIMGIFLITFILISFLKKSQNKLLRSIIIACTSIFLIHLFLYILGFFPLSPTRHSLYLTTPLTILCIIGVNYLMIHLNLTYSKLTNSLFSLAILFFMLIGGYLNVNYIFNRADPFDKKEVLKLLESKITPKIVLNSDWTYQHYSMPEVKKSKILLNLNLHGGREKFPEILQKIEKVLENLNTGDTIDLMRISHWSPDKKNTQIKEITNIICKQYNYDCFFKSNKKLFSSTKRESPEWIPNIQGFSNSLYINRLEIVVNDKNS